jgi:hypothetical protein
MDIVLQHASSVKQKISQYFVFLLDINKLICYNKNIGGDTT